MKSFKNFISKISRKITPELIMIFLLVLMSNNVVYADVVTDRIHSTFGILQKWGTGGLGLWCLFRWYQKGTASNEQELEVANKKFMNALISTVGMFLFSSIFYALTGTTI